MMARTNSRTRMGRGTIPNVWEHLDVLRRSLKPRTDVETTGTASVGGRPMRPFESGPAAQSTAAEDTGDRLREALERNRELLAIIGSLPGAAYRYVRRADG